MNKSVDYLSVTFIARYMELNQPLNSSIFISLPRQTLIYQVLEPLRIKSSKIKEIL